MITDFKPVTYHIIGGGISGLFCAWYAKKTNKNVRTVIYEASSRLGGKVYSEYDSSFLCNLNRHLHIIRKSDKTLSLFIGNDEWKKMHCFIDLENDEISMNKKTNKQKELKCLYNTEPLRLAKIFKKKHLLSSCFASKKFFISAQNINQRLINILSAYADEIHYNHKLQYIKSYKGNAQSLLFGGKNVAVAKGDIVIVALDNKNCANILNTPILKTNSITNIVYKTSQKIFLPKGASCITLINGTADRIFVDENIITAVIYNSNNKFVDENELSIKIWAEIDKIRGVNSAFLPPYKITICNNATISLSEENNFRRPISPRTEFDNVFIAGDWTMKNMPCSMETSAISAQRAVKYALKNKTKIKEE